MPEFVHAQILHEAQSTYQKKNRKPQAVPACFRRCHLQYNNKEATYANFQVGSPEPIKPGTISTYCIPPGWVVQRQDLTGHCPVVFIHMASVPLKSLIQQGGWNWTQHEWIQGERRGTGRLQKVCEERYARREMKDAKIPGPHYLASVTVCLHFHSSATIYRK